MTDISIPSPERRRFDLDLDRLLHPAQAFGHPEQVLLDPDLTLAEKRAILASWVSDACAVESVPELRQAPGSDRPVAVEDILAALRTLDHKQRAGDEPRWKRILRRGRLDRLRDARVRSFAQLRLRQDDDGPLPAA